MDIEGKRVAALVGDGFEESELFEPKRALEDAGAIVTIVGADEKSLQKIRGKKGLDEGQSVKAEELVADVTADDFDAVIIPGGYSPDHMRRCKPMIELVTKAARDGKVVAAICHGPWMLCSAKCLKGRRVTGFYAIRDDVENAGGVWEDAAVVRDGNLVTSRTPDDLPDFLKGILAAMGESA